MAGNTGNLMAPWPYGHDSTIEWQSGDLSLAAEGAGTKTFDIINIPYACKVVRAEYSAQIVTLTAGLLSVTVVDNESSPQTIVNANSVVAATDGTNVALTVADQGPLIANGQLSFKYTVTDSGGANVTVKGLRIRLYVQPSYA